MDLVVSVRGCRGWAAEDRIIGFSAGSALILLP
jgi:hypothetical protein